MMYMVMLMIPTSCTDVDHNYPYIMQYHRFGDIVSLIFMYAFTRIQGHVTPHIQIQINKTSS